MTAAKEVTQRVVARVPAKVRETIQTAAELQGSPLNQFVVQAAYHAAQEVIERQSRIELNSRQAKQVFDLVENPPKANRELIAAARTFKEKVRA